MVKSEKIFSPQEYLELVTGECYVVTGDDDIKFIDKILTKNARCLWNYPLSEIDHIVDSHLNVVLVDCMVFNDMTLEYEHVYRWFEVEGD